MVTTTGWTPSTPSPRSASSRARDPRSPRRHASCCKAGRPAPAHSPGRALVGSDHHTSSHPLTRRLIIRSLRGDLLGVSACPGPLRRAAKHAEPPLCAPAEVCKHVGGTAQNRFVCIVLVSAGAQVMGTSRREAPQFWRLWPVQSGEPSRRAPRSPAATGLATAFG
jgi:hypothetical protein